MSEIESIVPVPHLRRCQNCSATIDEDDARYCPFCGIPLQPQSHGGSEQVTVVRHRLGGQSVSVVRPAAAIGSEANPLSNKDELHAFTPAPGTGPTAPVVSTSRRRRHRRRKPVFRRPLIVVPALLLALFVAFVSTVVFRVNSTLESVHQISTIPPLVSDSTFHDGDGADPNDPPVPSQVDTSPAKAALETSNSTWASGAQQQGGITNRLGNVANSTGDIARSAMAASGVADSNGNAITLLVMGVDARPGAAIDIGVRPDAFMLVRLDPTTNSCRVLSVPRDTRVNLPGYGESKINHALMVGGIPYELLVTEQYLGISIDHYLLVDFQSFEQMVDLVGGISVKVPADLEKNGKLYYKAGTYELDGKKTLAYARYRAVPDGDTGRVERQWTILSALAKASASRTAVTDVNTLLPQIDDHIRTDLSANQMVSITRQYGDVCKSTSADSIKLMDGSRVLLSDPILKQSAYFNVVSESTRKERIQEFLYGVSGPTGRSTPVPTSPTPTPISSPAAVLETKRGRRSVKPLLGPRVPKVMVPSPPMWAYTSECNRDKFAYRREDVISKSSLMHRVRQTQVLPPSAHVTLGEKHVEARDDRILRQR